MRWPWVTRETLERERAAALAREREAVLRGRQIAALQVREETMRCDEILADLLLPFVKKWASAEAKQVGGSVAVTLNVHPRSIDEFARYPELADRLGYTLGKQFAAELRGLRLVEVPPGGPARRLW